MRFAIAVLTALACGMVHAASAPFIQIAGPGSGLADACTSNTRPVSVRVNAELTPGSSWSYAVGYVMPADNMYVMDMMMMDMMGMEMDVFITGSGPQNGPTAARNAPLTLGTSAAWYGASGRVAGTQLVVVATAYSGPNATGEVVASSRMTWNCDNGAVMERADMLNASGALPADTATTKAIEYYNAKLDHYVVSANAAEIANLDSGATAGWNRTGLSFDVFTGPAAGTSPVCRMYIPPGSGDSHFLSASPSECATVQAKFPTFVYESASVFYVMLPNATTGACPSFTTPVYRAWNNRADSNHRYTTDPGVLAQMVAQGAVAEGYGPNAVIMCAPVSA